MAPTMISTVAREAGVDLIAMATHGRGGVARLVMGSVAAGVLQRAGLPILLTRPAAVPRPMTIPLATQQPEPAGPAVGLTLTAGEIELLEEGLNLLLSTAERQEHLANPIHTMLDKLNQARSEASQEPVEASRR